MASTGEGGRDALFAEAIRIICQHDKASASLLQRRLSIGYSRAARILDQLEAVGVVGRAEGSKPRDVLVRDAEEFIANLRISLEFMIKSGEKLQQARLEKGLTLEDVAKSTKIKTEFLSYMKRGICKTSFGFLCSWICQKLCQIFGFAG